MAMQSSHRRMLSLAFLACALASSAFAADPTTQAAGTSNGEPYSFGTWTGHPVIMALNCSPGTSDCNATRYCIDTTDTCDPTGPAGTDYSGEVNVSTQGTVYIRYASNSSAGAWGEAGSRKMMIDIIPPEISIEDNAAGSWGVSDAISVLAGDDGSGVYSVRWVARNDPGCNSTQDAELDNGHEGLALVASDSSIYYNKYICFRAKDHAGGKNYTVSDRLSNLDTIATNASAGEDVAANAPFSRLGAANDSISGIANVLWAKESGPGILNFSDPHSLNTTVGADIDGIYVVRLSATDGAGNIGSSSFTLKWSTTPP